MCNFCREEVVWTRNVCVLSVIAGKCPQLLNITTIVTSVHEYQTIPSDHVVGVSPSGNAIQRVGFCLAVAGFILGFLNRSQPVFPHALIGIIAMGLALWQPINALYRPDHKKGEKDSILRWIWYFIHMVTGRFALLLGLVNICLGLFLIISPSPVWITWYILLSLYIVFLIVMEIIYWMRRFRSNSDEKLEKKE